MFRVVIILFDAFANFRGRDSHNRICVGVVVGWPAEEFHAQNTLFELVGLTGQSACDNKPQKTGIPFARVEQRGGEQLLELLLNSPLFRLR